MSHKTKEGSHSVRWRDSNMQWLSKTLRLKMDADHFEAQPKLGLVKSELTQPLAITEVILL